MCARLSLSLLFGRRTLTSPYFRVSRTQCARHVQQQRRRVLYALRRTGCCRCSVFETGDPSSTPKNSSMRPQARENREGDEGTRAREKEKESEREEEERQWKHHDGMPRRRGRFNALGVFSVFSLAVPAAASTPSRRLSPFVRVILDIMPPLSPNRRRRRSSASVLRGRKPAARRKSDTDDSG